MAPSGRSVRARRIASRQVSTARSACGSAVTVPSSSRTTASWRTCASATKPLVGRVVDRRAVVEQHVLGRLEAGDVEVPQPPEVEPAPDHRVDAADEVVLVHDRRPAVPADGAEREVVHRLLATAGQRDRDASYVRANGKAPTSAPTWPLVSSGDRCSSRPREVQVDDRLGTLGRAATCSPTAA